MKKLFILLSLTCGIIQAFGRTYYVDNKTGNDTFDGLSKNTAWQSLDRVNRSTFLPGDSILFHRAEVWHGQLVPSSSGSLLKPIVFGAYATGTLPEIKAEGHFRDVVLLRNVQYIELAWLSLSNFDPAVAEQKIGPTGVRIMAENIGTLHQIRLHGLYIHDINGDNKKGSSEGTGIFWDCRGPEPSHIEHLIIERCKLERVDRNGIRGNGTFAIRTKWFPNKYLVIRNCLLDDIGGDGIVVKAFDTALVEHNKLFHIRTRAVDNAVAIWPHSSDNATIQYNEVAYTKNTNWANDGQSFDIDGNCRNTTIQYNYSHDNDGGFMLVISDVINQDNVKTGKNIIRYNLSINDGLARKRLFNFAGKTDSTVVTGNVFYNDASKFYTVEVVNVDPGGAANNTLFENNYFQFSGKATAVFTQSPKEYKQVIFKNNRFSGNISGLDNLPVADGAPELSPHLQKPLVNNKQYPWMYLPRRLLR